MCSLLILRPAKPRSLSASGIQGSTSTKVSEARANQFLCETFRLGLEIKRVVCDGCQSFGVVDVVSHNDNVASSVSSIKTTLVT